MNRFLSSVIIFIILSIFIPYYFSIGLSQNGNYDKIVLVLFYILLAYSSFEISKKLFSRNGSIMEITFWIYIYVFAALASFVQIMYGGFRWPGVYKDDEKISAFFAIAISVISYKIGVRLNISNTGLNKTLDDTFLTRTWLGQIFLIIIVIALIFIQGGVAILFSSRISYSDSLINDVGQSNYALISSFLRAIPFTILVIYLTIIASHGFKSIAKTNIKITFIFIIILFLLTSNPFYSPRFWLGTAILTLILIFITVRIDEFTGKLIWISLLIGSTLFLFPASDVFRYTIAPSDRTVIEEKSDLPARFMIYKGDYNALQMTLNTQRFIYENNFQYGRQLSGSLLLWIPRSLWPDKPYNSGVVVAEAVGYDYTNLDEPLWSEAYIDFGYFGITLFFLLYGMVAKRYFRIKDIINSPIGLFILVFIPYQTFFLRGSLLVAILYITPVIAVIAFLSFSGNTSIRRKHK